MGTRPRSPGSKIPGIFPVAKKLTTPDETFGWLAAQKSRDTSAGFKEN